MSVETNIDGQLDIGIRMGFSPKIELYFGPTVIGAEVGFGCTACKLAVSATTYFGGKPTTRELQKLTVDICKSFTQYGASHCDQLRNLFQVTGDILSKAVKKSSDICGLFIRGCGKAFDLDYPYWIIDIPPNKPPTYQAKSPKVDAPYLQILHITDIHYDPDYTEGGDAQCDLGFCCHNDSASSLKHRDVVEPAGRWGTYGKCDIPWRTVENLFQQLSKDKDVKFDMIYFTGDLLSHDIYNANKTSVVEQFGHLANAFKKYFPAVPVYQAIGNHDTTPVNLFPPHKMGIEFNKQIGWLYNALADYWTTWLPAEAAHTIKRMGSYTVKPYTGFRIISINTQQCYELNYWLFLNHTDSDGLLQWLVEQLSQAENVGDKVHIIGHIPPGSPGCFAVFSKNYYRIVNRFENTIVGQFFGHEHVDSFSVFYEDGRPTNYYSIAPALTVLSSRGRIYNPGFKIYKIDGNYPNSSWALLDEVAYWTNLTEANLNGMPEWKLLYSTKAAYNMPSLRPQDWNDLISRLKTNATLFDLFISHYFRNESPDCEPNSTCRNTILCSMQNAMSYAVSGLCDDLPKSAQPEKVSLLASLLSDYHP